MKDFITNILGAFVLIYGYKVSIPSHGVLEAIVVMLSGAIGIGLIKYEGK